MKVAKSKAASQKLAGTVQAARLRVATAENRWKAAKEQARVAKRRRKEVKRIARRARKQAKQAKADLARARKALAEAEAKLAESGARRETRKPAKAKARPVAKVLVPTAQGKAAPVPAQAGYAIDQLDGVTSEPVVVAGAPAGEATRTTSSPESSPAAN